jgi:MFS family permease
MTMLRLLPMGLLGAFIGAWAEKIERRITLIVVVMLMSTTSTSLTLLAHSDHLATWHLPTASFLNGLGWATDNSVLIIGDAVALVITPFRVKCVRQAGSSRSSRHHPRPLRDVGRSGTAKASTENFNDE